MKPSSFSSKKPTPTSLFVTDNKETPKKPLSIQEYLIEISSDANQSANIMIDISDLHSHFIIDLDEKCHDSSIDFPALAKQFKEHHGIEFIHKNVIKIHPDHIDKLLKRIKEYRRNTKAFNLKLNVFLLAHGGPAWFFGPIQDFFKEKIGMVWDNQHAIPVRPYYHYSHFVLTPTQLFFFPKGVNVAINCQLTADDLKKIKEIFNENNLKNYYRYLDFGLIAYQQDFFTVS